MIVSHLYKITNKITNEYYIGKHNGWDQRKKDGKLYWGSGKRMMRQVSKYGKENFEYKILVYGTPEYIYELEQKMVTLQLIESDEKCLNLKTGGEGSIKHTEETVKKIKSKLIELYKDPEKRKLKSEITKRTYRNNPEIIKKISKSSLGKKLSEETKNKIREIRAKQVFTKESIEKRNKVISSLIWMNDGNRSYRIRPENIQASKEKGLVEGRITSYIDDKYKDDRRQNSLNLWKKLKDSGHVGILKKMN